MLHKYYHSKLYCDRLQSSHRSVGNHILKKLIRILISQFTIYFVNHIFIYKDKIVFRLPQNLGRRKFIAFLLVVAVAHLWYSKGAINRRRTRKAVSLMNPNVHIHAQTCGRHPCVLLATRKAAVVSLDVKFSMK